MSVLALNFWPWFWTLTLVGATVTAVLVLIVSLTAQQRAGHPGGSGTPYERPASAPADTRGSHARTSVLHEERLLARR
jgi:hypothetical protein